MSEKKDKTLVEVLAESLRDWMYTFKPDDTESESEGDDDE